METIRGAGIYDENFISSWLILYESAACAIFGLCCRSLEDAQHDDRFVVEVLGAGLEFADRGEDGVDHGRGGGSGLGLQDGGQPLGAEHLSGGVFGNGTNVLDNGGVHGLSCNDVNNNASLLTSVAAGTYTLSVFYDDREQTGAAFSIGLDTLSLTPVATPEPGTIALLGAGLCMIGLPLLRRKRA